MNTFRTHDQNPICNYNKIKLLLRINNKISRHDIKVLYTYIFFKFTYYTKQGRNWKTALVYSSGFSIELVLTVERDLAILSLISRIRTILIVQMYIYIHFSISSFCSAIQRGFLPVPRNRLLEPSQIKATLVL